MAWISFGVLPCRKKNLITARGSMLLKSRAFLSCFRACFLPGRTKDLSAPGSSSISSSSISSDSSTKLLFAYVQAGVLFSLRRVQDRCTNFFYCPWSFVIPWITFNKTTVNNLNLFSVLATDRIISVCQADKGSFTVCSNCLKVSNWEPRWDFLTSVSSTCPNNVNKETYVSF